MIRRTLRIDCACRSLNLVLRKTGWWISPQTLSDMSDSNKVCLKVVSRLENGAASSGVIAHIHSATEHEKALLARELHDELGGLLVGAVMDVAWAEQHSTASPEELKQKLMRARQALSAAIDLKRRLIEELRPTLLDNVGLFAALRWHVQTTCKRAHVDCKIDLPEDERRFLPDVPIALFRIVQEALALMLSTPLEHSADVSVQITEDCLTIQILRKTGLAASSESDTYDDSYPLVAIKHRTATLQGAFVYSEAPKGTQCLKASFPLDGLLAV